MSSATERFLDQVAAGDHDDLVLDWLTTDTTGDTDTALHHARSVYIGSLRAVDDCDRILTDLTGDQREGE